MSKCVPKGKGRYVLKRHCSTNLGLESIPTVDLTNTNLTPAEAVISSEVIDYDKLKGLKPVEEEVLPNVFDSLTKEELRKLTPRRRRFIMLYSQGTYSLTEIAEILGYAYNTVTQLPAVPEIKKVIDIIQAQNQYLIRNRINNLANKALDTMCDLLSSDLDNVRLSASKDLLDRAGHKATHNIAVQKTVTNIEQDLAKLKEFSLEGEIVEDVTEELNRANQILAENVRSGY